MELTVKLPQAESKTVEASVTKPASSSPESSTVVEASGVSTSSEGTKYLSPKAKVYVTGDATLVGGEQTITDDKPYTMTVEYTLEPHYGKMKFHLKYTLVKLQFLSRKLFIVAIKKSQMF